MNLLPLRHEIGTKKLQHTSARHIYLNPLFTLVGSAILLDEHLTIIALIGAACIMGGVYMAGKK